MDIIKKRGEAICSDDSPPMALCHLIRLSLAQVAPQQSLAPFHRKLKISFHLFH